MCYIFNIKWLHVTLLIPLGIPANPCPHTSSQSLQKTMIAHLTPCPIITLCVSRHYNRCFFFWFCYYLFGFPPKGSYRQCAEKLSCSSVHFNTLLYWSIWHYKLNFSKVNFLKARKYLQSISASSNIHVVSAESFFPRLLHIWKQDWSLLDLFLWPMKCPIFFGSTFAINNHSLNSRSYMRAIFQESCIINVRRHIPQQCYNYIAWTKRTGPWSALGH